MLLRTIAVIAFLIMVCPTLEAQDPSFSFSVTDAEQNFDPDDGLATFCVDLAILGANDPGASSGFDMVLSYDADLIGPDTLELGTVLAELNEETGPDYYYVDVLTVDDGSGDVVGAISIEILYDDDGLETIEFALDTVVFELCFVTVADALIDDTDGETTELTFSDDIEEIGVVNAVRTESDPVDVTFIDSTVTLNSVDFFEYIYTMSSPTFAYDENNGEGWGNVIMSIEENTLGPDYPQVTYGFSMSIDWDDTIVEAFDVLPCGLMLTINDDAGPDYFEADLTLDDGLVLGVVYSQTLDTSHVFDDEFDVVAISFETVPGAFDTDETATAVIEWVDGLGVSSVDNEVILIDRAATVELNNGEIEWIPHTGRFKRGDVDGNGSVFPLLDGLALLEYGFTNGPAPPCMEAADVDDNGVVFPILDSIYLLEYGFIIGAPAPAPPGPVNCGVDGTPDDLGCKEECP